MIQNPLGTCIDINEPETFKKLYERIDGEDLCFSSDFL
jgi:hypothetical protein